MAKADTKGKATVHVGLDVSDVAKLEAAAKRRGDPWTVASLVRHYVRLGLESEGTK